MRYPVEACYSVKQAHKTAIIRPSCPTTRFSSGVREGHAADNYEHASAKSQYQARFTSLLKKIQHLLIFEPYFDTSKDEVNKLNFKKSCKLAELRVPTTGDYTLEAWYMPKNPARETIVYVHCNSGTIARDFRIKTFKAFLERGFSVFAYNHRGYGSSEGSPSEQALKEDFQAVQHFLTKRLRIPSEKQIIVGESLGGGVVIQGVAQLEASQSKPMFRAVVPYATFTSIADVVANKKRWLRFGPLRFFPVEKLFQQVFDSASVVSQIKSPVLMAHSATDDLIPLEMGKRLFTKVKENNPINRHLVIPRAEHNEVFIQGQAQILEALEELLKQA